MDIIEKYKDSLKAVFMADPISSRLFYFLYFNFDYVYFAFLKLKYKGIIDVTITKVLECYETIKRKDDYKKLMK